MYNSITVEKNRGRKICRALAIAGYWQIMKPLGNGLYELKSKCSTEMLINLCKIYK